MQGRPCSSLVIFALSVAAALVGSAAGCLGGAKGPGRRPGSGTGEVRARARRGAPDAAALKRAREAICDRVEDCAIERNVALARAFGGTPADIDVARMQARLVLHSGYVRRWCQMRMGRHGRGLLMRLHGCLAVTACEPFYRCVAQTRGRMAPAAPAARVSRGTPK